MGSSSGHPGDEPALLHGNEISLTTENVLIIKLNLTLNLLS